MREKPYEGLAATFDTAAELYEQARPGYPPQLFDDLAALPGLEAGPVRVLEVGAGTGQATRGLLARGWGVVALEPGRELARVARRVLAGRGDVEIVTAAFEQWQGEDASFDLVLAATSWHWLDPTIAHAKAARLLRPAGTLAVVATAYVLPAAGGDSFFRRVEEAYDSVGMGDGMGGPPAPDAVEAPDVASIDDSGHFEPAVVHRYVSEHSYSTEEYLALLSTYSGHITASPQQRETLFADIRCRIDGRPSRTVRKHYLHLLQTARRRT
jgi:SAM-dependent methyltransferase